MKFIFYLLFIFMAPGAFASVYKDQISTLQDDLIISLEKASFISKNNTQNSKKLLNKSEVSINQAIKIAISSFKSSYDEGNQTPLDIILEKSYEEDLEGVYADSELTQLAKKELENLLVSENTSLVLVNQKKTGEVLGFDPSTNWVFELKIPSIKGFTFWCVISKFGDEEPFIFGEN